MFSCILDILFLMPIVQQQLSFSLVTRISHPNQYSHLLLCLLIQSHEQPRVASRSVESLLYLLVGAYLSLELRPLRPVASPRLIEGIQTFFWWNTRDNGGWSLSPFHSLDPGYGRGSAMCRRLPQSTCSLLEDADPPCKVLPQLALFQASEGHSTIFSSRSYGDDFMLRIAQQKRATNLRNCETLYVFWYKFFPSK